MGNNLEKVMALGNQCMPVQIPIACHELCSEQLKCFPVSSSSRTLGVENPNLSQISLIWGRRKKKKNSSNLPNLHYLSQRPYQVSEYPYWKQLSGKVSENNYHVKFKSYECFGKKNGAHNSIRLQVLLAMARNLSIGTRCIKVSEGEKSAKKGQTTV